MSTKNSFILALIRKVSLSIAVIGLAIACRSKTESNGNNRNNSIKTKEEDGGLNKNRLDDDDEEEEIEDNLGPAFRDRIAGDKLKGDGHDVDITKKKDPITKKTETTVKITSKDDKSKDVDKTGAAAALGTDKTSTPGEDNDKSVKDKEAENTKDEDGDGDGDETQEDSASASSTEFKFDDACCNGGWFKRCCKFWKWKWFRKRNNLDCFPEDYELSTTKTKINCCRDLVRKNRKTTRRSTKRLRKAQKMALLVGATTNSTSSTTCKIRNVGVSYFKRRAWWQGGLLRTGIKRRAKNMCKTCEPSLCRKDRIAVVSFHREIGLRYSYRRSSVPWNDPCEPKLCNLADLYTNKTKDGCKPGCYPKVGLKLVAKLHYVYDKEEDKNCPNKKYTYRIKGTHRCSLESILSNSVKKTRTFGGKTYTIHETCLKTGEFCGEYHDKCCWYERPRLLWKMLRSRHGLAFALRDDNCPPTDCEPKCETDCDPKGEPKCEEPKPADTECCNKPWKEIQKLRRKGDNALKFFWGLFKRPNMLKSSRRMIKIEKLDCNGCVIEECLALVDFVWQFTVLEKEGEKPVTYEVEHNFYWL